MLFLILSLFLNYYSFENNHKFGQVEIINNTNKELILVHRPYWALSNDSSYFKVNSFSKTIIDSIEIKQNQNSNTLKFYYILNNKFKKEMLPFHMDSFLFIGPATIYDSKITKIIFSELNEHFSYNFEEPTVPSTLDSISNINNIDSTIDLSNLVEQYPEFYGGEKALNKYVKDRVIKVKKELKITKSICFNARFYINEYGEVKDVKIENCNSKKINKEIKNLFGNMPKWKPGKQGFKYISVYLNFNNCY